MNLSQQVSAPRRVLGSEHLSQLLAQPPRPARASFVEVVDDTAHRDPREDFELGWDFAMLGVTAPADVLAQHPHFEVGWRAGCEHWRLRRATTKPYERKWLQLRVSAMKRGRPFSPDLTPDYLESVDVLYCPVTRQRLTRGTGEPSDGSADRLNSLLGYVPGNVVIMSVAANQAKDRRSALQMLQIVRELDADGADARHLGLDSREWARLATLTAFSEPGANPATVDAWPLVVMPAKRIKIANARWYFKTTCAVATIYPERGDPKVISGKKAMRAYADFRTALQAAASRRLTQYAGVHQQWALHFASEDAWHEPLVNQRWAALARHLPLPDVPDPAPC